VVQIETNLFMMQEKKETKFVLITVKNKLLQFRKVNMVELRMVKNIEKKNLGS
jgi:hypothetical protein